jgi:alkanesulfonate monooxygenase SsuD/methylene tetrahydromethanopterin reductase-like flavin-dependent oxidoreductase (luciferase family)
MVRTAMLADELGYEIFALPEGWGLDSTPVLTEIALRTARIHLASGILSVWGRTPATLAMTAATLHQVCGGRYVLGLGASTKALVEGFHDTAFEHPAAKLRDVVTKVRALLAGQPAQLSHARPPARCAWASRRRHRHNPAAAGHALAQHRSDPPGRSAKRPARMSPGRSLINGDAYCPPAVSPSSGSPARARRLARWSLSPPQPGLSSYRRRRPSEIRHPPHAEPGSLART